MKVLTIGVCIALCLLALAFGSVYAVSELKLRDVAYDAPFDHPIPTDAASIENGRYVARTRGCFGCHGQQLEGMDFDEQWDWPARAVAPNLAAYARTHDVATLEAAIRQGIGADGRSLVSMPSFNFTRLSDSDTADLIAFLRSAPAVELELPSPRLGWQARRDLAFGDELRVERWADAVPDLRIEPDADSLRARGEYLAMTTCNECHGLDLRGANLYGMPTPDLALVGAIGRDEFARIIRTGRGFGGRHLGLMTLVAPDRFPTLTAEDVDALYAHLSSLRHEPVQDGVFWRPGYRQE